ncbi:serine/threonine-protein kinase [Actinoplanes sp. NPDC023714]|uniref:serine/threonine protein kinase n=1 Tax=Actinoplanes sp. NPDC023714 TaxID=3154322 RepID=UPI0033EDC152
MARPTKLGPHDPPGVGPYTFLARLGRGGQGEVYLAADRDGERVAVKVLRVDWDASGAMKRYLDRELVNARKVVPFVTARVLDFDVTGEIPYIVSEYIEGPTLAEQVREHGPLGGSQLMLVASQSLNALEAIHHARVIHCDFKPANIILGQGGARVIDFGIAKALDSTHRVGHIAGTIPYMAPEQLRSEQLTSAVDLFAWGATFVFAAADRPAFPGEMREEIAHRILTQPPELYATEEPLRTVVRACLEKRPEHRPTAAQARRMLLGAPDRAAARPRSGAPRTASAGPRTRRRPAPAPPPSAAPARTAAAARPAATRIAPEPTPDTRGSTWKGAAAMAAAVLTAAVVALVWAIPRSSGDPPPDGQAAGAESPLPSPVVTDSLLQPYEAFWTDATCRWESAPPTSQLARRNCKFSQDGVALLLYCSRYPDVTVMRRTGRPAGEDNGIWERNIFWRDEWYREDGPVTGQFVAYRLSSSRKGIWWEDSAVPVACMIHGDTSMATIVAAFTGHGFRLRNPVPSST